MHELELSEHERHLVSCVSAGRQADFRGNADALPRLRGEVIRRLLLGLPVTGEETCQPIRIPGGLIVSNATIESGIDLEHASGSHGDDALAPLVLSECVFAPPAPEDGVDTPAPDVNLGHARIVRIALTRCRFALVNLADAWILGDFDFDGAAAVDGGTACRIHGPGARIGGSVRGDGAALVVDPAAHAGAPLPYALNLRDARVDGSVFLGSGFKATGGVRMPSRVGGDVYIEGATLTGNVNSEALMAQSCIVGGNFVLRASASGNCECDGPISLYGLTIGGTLDLSGAVIRAASAEEVAINGRHMRIDGSFIMNERETPGQDPLTSTVIGSLVLSASTIAKMLDIRCALRGALFIDGVHVGLDLRIHGRDEPGEARLINLQGSSVGGGLALISTTCEVYAPMVRVGGECYVKSAPGTAPKISFVSAVAQGNVFLVGGFERIDLHGIRVHGQLRVGEGSSRQVQGYGLRVDGDLVVERVETLVLSGAECEGSVTIRITDADPAASVLATTLSVAHDLVAEGAFAQLELDRARVGGKLDLDRTRVEGMDASGMRVEGIVFLPADILGRVRLRAGKFSSGLALGRSSGVRLHARRLPGQTKVGSIDLEDVEVVGDMKLTSVTRVPERGVRETTQSPPDWMGDPAAIEAVETHCPFYLGARLVELHTADASVAGYSHRAAAFLVSNDRKIILQLGGDASSIYEANRMLGLRLQRPEQVIAYLKLFCGFVWGDKETFQIVEETSDEAWQSLVDEKDRELAATVRLDAGTLTRDKQRWKLSVPIVHGTALFRSVLAVNPDDGVVEMLQDEPIVALKESPVALQKPFWLHKGEPGNVIRLMQTQWSSLQGAEKAEWIEVIQKSLTKDVPRDVDDGEHPDVFIDLRGARCDTLDDDDGSAWGKEVYGNLQGFVYSDIGHSAGLRRSFGTPPTHGKRLASERVAWLERIALKTAGTGFSPAPYEQLVSVLNRRGDNEAARGVMLERLALETKAKGPVTYMLMKLGLEWPFQYGLFSRNAICVFVAWLLLGVWAFDYANYGHWRPVPIGAPSTSQAMQGRAPLLVLDSNPVTTLVTSVNGRSVPATERAEEGQRAVVELPCADQVEAVLYAIDVMLPLLELHQEGKCTISSDDTPVAAAWRIFKGFYSIVGAYIVSMTILTVSGVLRRAIER
jgi:hypothetical protein